MIYRRIQASEAMHARLLTVLDCESRPQEMLPVWRGIGWLASEAFRGRFESFSGFGRTLRNALELAREQARFDRQLAAVEHRVAVSASAAPALSPRPLAPN
jgi:hypothetical protein